MLAAILRPVSLRDLLTLLVVVTGIPVSGTRHIRYNEETYDTATPCFCGSTVQNMSLPYLHLSLDSTGWIIFLLSWATSSSRCRRFRIHVGENYCGEQTKGLLLRAECRVAKNGSEHYVRPPTGLKKCCRPIRIKTWHVARGTRIACSFDIK